MVKTVDRNNNHLDSTTSFCVITIPFCQQLDLKVALYLDWCFEMKRKTIHNLNNSGDSSTCPKKHNWLELRMPNQYLTHVSFAIGDCVFLIVRYALDFRRNVALLYITNPTVDLL